jgi:hypothetical protein
MCPARLATEALADMPGLLGGPHDLADERVRPALLRPRSRTRPSLTRRSSSRRLTEVPRCARMAMALSVLKCLVFRLEAPAGWCDEMAKYPNLTNHLRPAEGGAFPLPSCGRARAAVMPHRQTCELMRNCAKRRHSDHGEVRCADLGTKRLSAGG